MNKRLYVLTSLALAAALLLSACNDKAAAPADVDYWPWNWGNSTLEATLAHECAGLPAGSSVSVNGGQVPCPGTEAAPVGQAVEVTQFGTWPHQNGRNKTEEVTALADGYVLVQYGFEARLDGKEVPGCGIALIAPNSTASLTVWDGNAETLRGSLDAVTAYAQSELSARQTNEARCKTWTVIGLP